MSTVTVSQQAYDYVTSRIGKLEKRLEKTEKELRDLKISLWIIPIAALIGFYWDDIWGFISRVFTGA